MDVPVSLEKTPPKTLEIIYAGRGDLLIYTTHANLHRYLGISAELDKAIDYLKKTNLQSIPLGLTKIDGEAVYVNCFEYSTVPQADAMWEGHRNYADIHVVLSGQEKIGVSDACVLTKTTENLEDDFVGYTGAVQTWFSMNKNQILIVFPEDIHMVRVQQENKMEHVHKMVIKVRV